MSQKAVTLVLSLVDHLDALNGSYIGYCCCLRLKGLQFHKKTEKWELERIDRTRNKLT